MIEKQQQLKNLLSSIKNYTIVLTDKTHGETPNLLNGSVLVRIDLLYCNRIFDSELGCNLDRGKRFGNWVTNLDHTYKNLTISNICKLVILKYIGTDKLAQGLKTSALYF